MTTQAERIKRLTVKCPCCRKGLATRSPAASRNELATAVQGWTTTDREGVEHNSLDEWNDRMVMMAKSLKVGDVVRFIQSNPDENPNQRFRIIEANGDRGYMQPIDGPGHDWSIVPTYRYAVAEVEQIKGASNGK